MGISSWISHSDSPQRRSFKDYNWKVLELQRKSHLQQLGNKNAEAYTCDGYHSIACCGIPTCGCQCGSHCQWCKNSHWPGPARKGWHASENVQGNDYDPGTPDQ